ncbi:hypothetical protein Tco_1541811 [Tanacetum coccineum]
MNVHDSAILEDSLSPKEKDQGSFTIPCYISNICFGKALADLGASVSVMPYSTFTNLGLGLRERMELDLEARLMGEALILNRSLDHVYGDYIELNDLNEPLELRRNQVEDLAPTIEDGEVIEKPVIEVVENMDAYRDQDMGEVIIGKMFCREIRIKAKRFDGIIIIYNGPSERKDEFGGILIF